MNQDYKESKLNIKGNRQQCDFSVRVSKFDLHHKFVAHTQTRLDTRLPKFCVSGHWAGAVIKIITLQEQ